jgi:4-diphosphocytidyl-2-C-methyl-D-erythritol kinase
VLLANPGIPLATEAVYAALRATVLREPPQRDTGRLEFASFKHLVEYMLPRGNDLEEAAARLVPEIREVLAALAALPGARIVRLSGSGPTCFALFATEREAERAGAALLGQRPSWWIAASTLGS